MQTNADKVLAMAKKRSVLRTREVEAAGIPRAVLSRLVDGGELERVGRGIYALPNADVSEHHALAEACKRVPHGVVCLLSALRFHEMTTQDPYEVWLAIDPKARKPKVDGLSLRIVRFGPKALETGIDHYDVEGVDVAVTSPERTVVDCFRYRNKIGIDVAVEALRDYLRDRRGSIDQLWKAAESVRAREVMRPYLEAMA